jgi:hypothetical protein
MLPLSTLSPEMSPDKLKLLSKPREERAAVKRWQL